MGIKVEMSGKVCVTFTWDMYIGALFIAFFVSLFVHYCNMMACVVYCVGKWQSRGSTGTFGNLMAIYYIILQFIWNQYRITNTKLPLQESSGSVVRNVWENVMKMVLLLSVYIPMWGLKFWCSLVLKILLFSRLVCYIFQVIWSEVERTSHCMGLMGLSPTCEQEPNIHTAYLSHFETSAL